MKVSDAAPLLLLFCPTSLTDAPSPKKIGKREIFVCKGGGRLYTGTQARAYWTWLLPVQCNGEQYPLTNARMHLKFKQSRMSNHKLINDKTW